MDWTQICPDRLNNHTAWGYDGWLYTIFKKIVYNTLDLMYGRRIISEWSRSKIQSSPNNQMAILDIGCGSGKDLPHIKSLSEKNIGMFGVECHEKSLILARNQGINVTDCLSIHWLTRFSPPRTTKCSWQRPMRLSQAPTGLEAVDCIFYCSEKIDFNSW